MTRRELVTLIEQYRAGMDAEIHLLHELDAIADRQRAVTATCDFEAFTAVVDARDRLTRSLVTIEEEMRRVRATLSGSRDDARHLDGFEAAVALHHQAADLVARILATDQASMQALADAEVSRRAVLCSLQQGETTLAAYRKVLAPPVASATLVDRQG